MDTGVRYRGSNKVQGSTTSAPFLPTPRPCRKPSTSPKPASLGQDGAGMGSAGLPSAPGPPPCRGPSAPPAPSPREASREAPARFHVATFKAAGSGERGGHARTPHSAAPPLPFPSQPMGAGPCRASFPCALPHWLPAGGGAGLGAVPRGAAGSCLRQGGGGGGSGLLPPPLRAACLPAMASRRSSRGTGGTPSPGPRRGERGWGRRSGAHGGSSVTHTPRVGALGRAEHPRVGAGALPGSLRGHTGLRAKDVSPREAAGQQSPGDAAWRWRSGGACSSNTGRARWGWLALLVKWSEKVTNTSS